MIKIILLISRIYAAIWFGWLSLILASKVYTKLAGKLEKAFRDNIPYTEAHYRPYIMHKDPNKTTLEEFSVLSRSLN